jgi:2-succinyl-5-enolpyruvyl-6-hydroxy-3-cyclohexene-1-carboxylate synthase
MDPREAAFRCAEGLLRGLHEVGMREVVISPGSRSTPLVLAAVALGFETHVILDERSAAFFALGAAHRSGRPVGVVCTSGTAAVNHGPAVVEADARGIPIVLLTADRPADLVGIGANQTIVQSRLHGSWAKALELPVGSASSLPRWRQVASEISLEGPTHVNAPFAEPFIPENPLVVEPIAIETPSARGGVEPEGTEAPGPGTEQLGSFLKALPTEPETLLSIGPGAHPEDVARIGALAERTGLPILASALSGARIPGTIGAMVFDEADLTPFDLVLHVGAAHTTRGVLRRMEAAGAMVTWDRRGRIHDPASRLRPSLTLTGAFDSEIPAVSRLVSKQSDRLGSLEARCQEVLSESESQLSEPMIARLCGKDLRHSMLFVGNSTPARDLERTMEPAEVSVTSNRGVSGIDGLISTICGSAIHGHVRGLLGDLSVLHDASGLMWLAPQSDATIVVVDNGGGGIFDLLPSAKRPEHERFFRTPHEGRLDRLLAASGAAVERLSTAEELSAAISVERTDGMRLLHVNIDRDHGLKAREMLVRRIREALA